MSLLALSARCPLPAARLVVSQHLQICPSAAPFTPASRGGRTALVKAANLASARAGIARRHSTVISAAAAPGLDALIFDCDGVIVDSENIHRTAYNAAFTNFEVRCPNGDGNIVDWSVEFYDMLQNLVGGGKPKMRWYFGQNGWPTSNVLDGRTPANDEEEALLIDTLQEWKTKKYVDIIGSGEIVARPGILEVMDSAKAAGVPVAVCSAATKEAALFVVQTLLGPDRFAALDLFMAGDDVAAKKPDPTIYRVASERLAVDPAKCLVVEDSIVGMQAAQAAGMPCLITYHSGTKDAEFTGTVAVLSDLQGVTFGQLASGELAGRDDRVGGGAAAAAGFEFDGAVKAVDEATHVWTFN